LSAAAERDVGEDRDLGERVVPEHVGVRTASA